MGHMVRPDQLDEVASAIVGITKELVDALEEADVVARRMQSVWAGDAANAHLDRHEVWRDDADLIARALHDLHHVLSSAHANYVAAVAANTAMWG